MLHIGDNLLVQYAKADQKYRLSEIINKKAYKVSDTPLTYRQVNTLDKDKLLSANQNKAEGWRKFSLKELVYIEIVYSLKEFGVEHAKLHQLWNSFFKERDSNQVVGYNKHYADTAIGCVFIGVEIILCFDSDGNFTYFDPAHYLLFNNGKPRIEICLNDVVNNLLEKSGRSRIPVTLSVFSKARDNGISVKEKEILRIIRDGKYQSVRITKKNGDPFVVYAERLTDSEKKSPRDILKIIESCDYQDISITKRDGDIIHCRVEETIKV